MISSTPQLIKKFLKLCYQLLKPDQTYKKNILKSIAKAWVSDDRKSKESKRMSSSLNILVRSILLGGGTRKKMSLSQGRTRISYQKSFQTSTISYSSDTTMTPKVIIV